MPFDLSALKNPDNAMGYVAGGVILSTFVWEFREWYLRREKDDQILKQMGKNFSSDQNLLPQNDPSIQNSSREFEKGRNERKKRIKKSNKRVKSNNEIISQLVGLLREHDIQIDINAEDYDKEIKRVLGHCKTEMCEVKGLEEDHYTIILETLDKFKKSLGALGDLMKELKELDNQAENNTINYNELLRRVEESNDQIVFDKLLEKLEESINQCKILTKAQIRMLRLIKETKCELNNQIKDLIELWRQVQ